MLVKTVNRHGRSISNVQPREKPRRGASVQGGQDATGRPFRPDIQGLRALAVLSVVIYHAGLPLAGGFAGVDVFFVISGFVITAMLIRESARDGRISLLRFYQRRFKRLTPALSVVVVCTVLASVLLLSPFGQQQIAAKTGVGAMFFVANYVIAKGTGGYFDPAASTNPLIHTWSLAVEEQFYFVYPLFFLLLHRFGRRVLLVGVTCVGVASFAAASLLSTAWPLGFYSPATRAWEFGVGAAVALLGRQMPRVMGQFIGAIGLVGLIVGFFVLGGARWPGVWTVVPVAATAMCIYAGAGSSGSTTRILAVRPLVAIGDYSYSLYLWHWPFISLATNWLTGRWVGPLAAVLSVGPAILSYRYVEERFRKRSFTGPRQWILVVTSTVMLPVVCAGALTMGPRLNWGSKKISSFAINAGNHPGWDDCLRLDTGGTGTRQIDPSRCTLGSSPGAGRVYLVGDSNAAMYSDPALATAEALKGKLVMRTAAGCPMVDAYRSSGGQATSTDRACRQFFEKTMAELADAPSGSVVFLGEAPSQWLLAGRGYSLTPSNFREDFAGRREIVRAGLSKTIASLRAKGLKPVLIEPMVTFPEGTTHNALASCRTTLSILDGSCPSPAPLRDEDPHSLQLRADVRSIARAAGVQLVRVADRQCPGGSCVPEIAEAPVIMDNGHFSAAFTRTLLPEFLAAVRRSGVPGA